MVEQIAFDVLARDRASQVFTNIGRSTQQLEARMARFQHTARNLFAGFAAAEVGRSILHATDAFELARSRVETITKNIGGNFDALAGQVNAADDRMARLGFTNAETENSLAALEAATRNPARALRDLALAADIARGRNISLEAATLILQRVETGHVSLLSKVGLQTKDAAGHTLTMAQALEMLQQRFGGAADAASKTGAGIQRSFSAEIQNSASQIGKALLPAAIDLGEILQHDVLPPIEATAKWLDRNKSIVEPLAKALIIGAAAWKTYTVAVKLAAETTALFTRNTVTAEAIAAGAAKSTALPDLRAVTLAEAANSAAFRARALSVGTRAAGGAALFGGQLLGGTAGNALTGAGIASLLPGSVSLAGKSGPLGLFAGAGLGAFGATTAALNAIFPRKSAGQVAQDSFDKLAGPKLKELVKEYGSLDAALDALRAHNRAAAESQRLLTGAMQTTIAQVDTSAKNLLDLSSAQDRLKQSFHEAAQVAADSGRSLRGNSDAALANRDALRSEVSALFGVIDAMKQRGASNQQQQAMLTILGNALETNALKTYGDKTAIDGLLHSMGLVPASAAEAASALADAAPKLSTFALSLYPELGAAQPILKKQRDKQLADAEAQAKKIAAAFTAGFTPVVSKAAKAAESAAEKAFRQMQEKMRSDLQSIRNDIDNTRNSLIGFANLTNNTGGTDTLGASGHPQSVLSFFKDRAAKLERFAKLFNQADKAGVDRGLLGQIAQVGPDAIPALEEILRGGRGGIRQINTLEGRINRAAGQVAIENAALQDNGLIHRDLQTLPPKIGREFISGLRKLHVITDAGKLDSRDGTKVLTSL